MCNILKRGINYWEKSLDSKSSLNSANKILSQKEIPILRISDYDTVGDPPIPYATFLTGFPVASVR